MTDWVRGDMLGLDIPAHPQALLDGGAEFLTRAFRATGSLAAHQRVAGILDAAVVTGGSTGTKMRLTVAYDPPSPVLHTQLFVKFSRDFDDAARDNARTQMEREVRFALLSRQPDFPITVPVCYCADYEVSTGTGILVTQQIPFGADGIERHYPKCRDYQLADDLPYYRALVGSLATLAAFDRAGSLPASLERDFPFDPAQLDVGQRARQTREQVVASVRRYAEFAGMYPGLLPDGIRSPEFMSRLESEAPRVLDGGPRLRQVLGGNPDLVALCHWNANVDNAWFWRTDNRELHCGLLDWGNVSRMNVAMALWGCLSGAEVRLWDGHLDELLAHFIETYHRGGGSLLTQEELDRHMALYAISMGVAWLLDVPAYLRRRLPDLDRSADRLHPDIQGDETIRVRLQMMTVFLNLWYHRDFDSLWRDIDDCQ